VTSFGWWERWTGPGRFLCQLCFETFPIGDAWHDEDGIAWDVCHPCKAAEDRVSQQR
jgi:hypothetical protein